MEHARIIRELGLHFRNRALTATDPFLCCELLELANICEAKASRIDHHFAISDRHSAQRRGDERSSRVASMAAPPPARAAARAL